MRAIKYVFLVSKKFDWLQATGLRKQKDRVEQACHNFWDFIVEVYHLAADGDDEAKDVSQRVEVDATLPSPIDSVSVEISPYWTSSRDRAVSLDTEQVEELIFLQL